MHLATLGYVLDGEGAWVIDSGSLGVGGNGSSDWDYSADGRRSMVEALIESRRARTDGSRLRWP